MIREALPHESYDYARFMKGRFAEATEFVKVDVEYTGAKYEAMMKEGKAFLFILEDESGEMIGGLGCVIGDDLHERRKFAIETSWLVDADHRKDGSGLKLLNHFESWAAKRGRIPVMIHLIDSYPKELEQLYIKKGYRLVEKHYIKEV